MMRICRFERHIPALSLLNAHIGYLLLLHLISEVLCLELPLQHRAPYVLYVIFLPDLRPTDLRTLSKCPRRVIIQSSVLGKQTEPARLNVLETRSDGHHTGAACILSQVARLARHYLLLLLWIGAREDLPLHLDVVETLAIERGELTGGGVAPALGEVVSVCFLMARCNSSTHCALDIEGLRLRHHNRVVPTHTVVGACDTITSYKVVGNVFMRSNGRLEPTRLPGL